MARTPGEEDKAHFVGGADGYYSIVIDDAEKLRITSDGTSITVPVLSGANANATAQISGTEHVIFADPGSTEMGLTLPSVGTTAGQSFTVKKIAGSAAVLISGSAATELIDGEVFMTLSTLSASLTLTSDGAAWHVTGYVSSSGGTW